MTIYDDYDKVELVNLYISDKIIKELKYHENVTKV